MFQYDFMQHAFIAGTFVAVMCGAFGVFVMARGLSFISHTFSHIGFSGASFAVFMGWDPLTGLLLFTTVSGLAVGQMGVKIFRRDAAVSVILSLFLGLGILFLFLSNKQTNFATTILFGSVVGISFQNVIEIVIISLILLIVLILSYRVLKFDSFDPAGAHAAGLPVRFISIGFLLVLSILVAEAVQIVGALLVFALLTVPASAARYLTHSVFGMILLSSLFSLIGVWAGLSLSYLTNVPVSFYITMIEAIFYFLALIWQTVRLRWTKERTL
ncbi:iron chelate uptake ABC transporter family permease subunit [Terrilactibacillus sp. BCM23-1]|uniref:Iron chelate uptake ABC transporter family permease subunit n=1 Tax=Terrilactibacillus tamarindi TaxID=2599694 RepID=A0A6N8CR48_9BACI|nr:metal ABC transporter permease [Terrilactibacillus tamarindi]MTT30436.1 iron chelate uptake ABC transporter family permease subunit [Terrilactibacillus tamarindi]